MSEFISNITFGGSAASVPTEAQRWQRFADRFVRDVESFLHDNTPEHCCYCDPQACNSSIPSGDCGELHACGSQWHGLASRHHCH